MAEYRYSPLLQPGNIRLLQLLPKKLDSVNLRCSLFECPLRNSEKTRPFEALSYCWGGIDRCKCIIVDDQNFKVTQNLYSALWHLQDHDIPRTLWVDAICIDQSDTNTEEKGHQILLMAEIYARASRVIVWLGEAQDNSNIALNAIQSACERVTEVSYSDEGTLDVVDEREKPKQLYSPESVQLAIRQLLERQWFRRIWILQEVASARQVLIMCGFFELDGHAFCSGLEFLRNTFISESPMDQANFLIRGAALRPKHISSKHQRFTLNILSLGELVDMYHAHNATIPHDRLYALLGMCSDDFKLLKEAGLEPDYTLKPNILMQRFVGFLLRDQASVCVCTSYHTMTAIIKTKGYILGKVLSAERNSGSGAGQTVEAILRNLSDEPRAMKDGCIRWTLRGSAKPIQTGDLICLFHGASKPTIIRAHQDHYDIIMIMAFLPNYVQPDFADNSSPQSNSFIRDLLLIWDWEHLEEPRKCVTWIKTCKCQSEYPDTCIGRKLENTTRIWNIASVLGDVGEDEMAEQKLQEATKSYEIGDKHQHTADNLYGLTPFSWAAKSGYSMIVNLLITKQNADIDLEDEQYGRTPLSWAASMGHNDIIQQLLNTGKVDLDSTDDFGRTPLSLAAEYGHEISVGLLLATNNVNIDAIDGYGRTPLSWAAASAHDAVVKRLLKGNATIDLKDNFNETPVSYAAQYGHGAIIKLLHETGKANIEPIIEGGMVSSLFYQKSGQKVLIKVPLNGKDVNLKDDYGRTPLSLAALYGHEDVARQLLATGKVDLESKNGYGQTPLLVAAKNGHEGVVKQLLTMGKVNVNSIDDYGQTPLLVATRSGHEAVVKQILATGKVDVNLEDRSGWTPLLVAAENGHEAVVKQLLTKSEVNLDSKDRHGQTPLYIAAENGNEAVVKQLLATGKVDVNLKARSDRTPLSQAAYNGHEAIVRQLLATGKADVNSKDEYNRTPLSRAAYNGHEAVVKQLLATGTVNIDSKDEDGRTPLSRAAKNGHEDVVRQLLATGKVDIDSKDRYGQTSLSRAAKNGHEGVVKQLLAMGNIDVDSKDEYGKTPLSRAAENGNKAMVKLLQGNRHKLAVRSTA